jgi:hypothetical protein
MLNFTTCDCKQRPFLQQHSGGSGKNSATFSKLRHTPPSAIGGGQCQRRTKFTCHPPGLQKRGKLANSIFFATQILAPELARSKLEFANRGKLGGKLANSMTVLANVTRHSRHLFLSQKEPGSNREWAWRWIKRTLGRRPRHHLAVGRQRGGETPAVATRA